MTGPARITITLEPPARPRDRWVARTRVDEPSRRDRESADVEIQSPVMVAEPTQPLPAPEQREPAVVPVGYEPPADCTCFDGFCDVDHANE
jgi:hypothetical protein